MSITLVFPPPFDISQPYISLPVLTGFLRRRGIDVLQRDLNVEFYDHILSNAHLKNASCRLRRNISGNPGERRLERALSLLPFIADGINSSKASLRDPFVLNSPDRYARDVRYLHRACEIVSAEYFPTEITLSTFVMRYRTSSFDEIFEASANELENPLIGFLTDERVDSIIQPNTYLIGISVAYTHQLIPALTIARAVKQRTNAPVVLGGELISRMIANPECRPQRFFEVVDGVVAGDGSKTLVDIYLAITAGRSIHTVPNLLTSATSVVEFTDRGRPSPTNLDELGCPDFDGLNLELYFTPKPVLPIQSGKGCEWGRCVFCTESRDPKFVIRRIDLLLKDVAKLRKKTGAGHFTFCDSDIPPTRLREIAKGLIDREIDIYWSCYARLTNRVDPELIELLSRSGCRQIYFGLETAVPRLLRAMKKGILIERIPALLRACRLNKIAAHLFAFVGFPGETSEDAWETARFILSQIEDIGSFNIGVFQYRNQAKIFEDSEKFGISAIHMPSLDGDQDNYTYSVADGMTMEEAEAVAKAAVAWLSAEMSRRGLAHSCSPSSGYIIRDDIPAWQSHSLLALATKRSGEAPSGTGAYHIEDVINSTVLLYREIRADIRFSPSTGKILRVSSTPRLSSSGVHDDAH